MSHRSEAPSEDQPTFAVSNKVYDGLRFVAVILLPGIGALYFGLAGVLALPAAEQVVGTITVVDTFLGLVVRSLRVSYQNSDARFDGSILVEPDEDAGVTNMNVSLDPEAVANKDEVVVKINKA